MAEAVLWLTWGALIVNLGLMVHLVRLARQWRRLRAIQLECSVIAWTCRMWPERLRQAEMPAVLIIKPDQA